MGVGLQRTERVAQLVADLSGADPGRVLDLGCNDGGFAVTLAQRGAREVVGIEGRRENLSKAIARRDAEHVAGVDFVHGDVRDLSRELYGEFDVVLCLGVLYHLDAPDVFEFTRQLASVCNGYAVIETQVGLAARERVEYRGRTYAGLRYSEDITRPGASLDNRRSFWLTKPSLLNLLADAGFTSVLEHVEPAIPELAAYRDHTLLVAFKGDRIAERERWPESLPLAAHPAQGTRWMLRDRLARVRGRGLPTLFR